MRLSLLASCWPGRGVHGRCHPHRRGIPAAPMGPSLQERTGALRGTAGDLACGQGVRMHAAGGVATGSPHPNVLVSALEELGAVPGSQNRAPLGAARVCVCVRVFVSPCLSVSKEAQACCALLFMKTVLSVSSSFLLVFLMCDL